MRAATYQAIAAGATVGVRQTACRFCGLDIEGFAPYRKGEWRDRGNNATCADGKHKHAPIRGRS